RLGARFPAGVARELAGDITETSLTDALAQRTADRDRHSPSAGRCTARGSTRPPAGAQFRGSTAGAESPVHAVAIRGRARLTSRVVPGAAGRDRAAAPALSRSDGTDSGARCSGHDGEPPGALSAAGPPPARPGGTTTVSALRRAQQLRGPGHA